MRKVTLIYTLLPGDKVKVIRPRTGEEEILSKEQFEEYRNDPRVQWMEYKRNDVGSQFQTDTMVMDLVNVNGTRVLHVKDKP